VSHLDDVTRIGDSGLVAIVRLDGEAPLLDIARALVAGGVDVLEFTMTTPGALDVLAMASKSLGDDLLLGAGTVLDSETARAAILAGARFIVSPTLSAAVIATCRRYSVVSIPGAYTPTEILTAWELGADYVKVFPAGGLGPRFLKDVLAPLPQVRLIPTGGVALDNIPTFFEAGAAAVAVGGNLVSKSAVASGDLNGLTAIARKFRAVVDQARAQQPGGPVQAAPRRAGDPARGE
jgi:2-dehydro-3-deoxyphosphogluconate aldolase / (4S)-4-hydroxy-2-oxoglutarate aldolase